VTARPSKRFRCFELQRIAIHAMKPRRLSLAPSSGQVQSQRQRLAEYALLVLFAQLSHLADAARPFGWRPRQLERRGGAGPEVLVEIAGPIAGETRQLGDGERRLGVDPQVEPEQELQPLRGHLGRHRLVRGARERYARPEPAESPGGARRRARAATPD